MQYDHLRYSELAKLSCQDVEELVDSFLDNEMEEVLMCKFDAHLHRCSACRELVGDCQEILQIARELDSRPIPGDISHRLHQALNQEIGEIIFKEHPSLRLVKSS